MRAAARLAFVLLVVAACGKKGDGDQAGGATPTPSAARAKADIPNDLVVPTLAGGLHADNLPDGPVVAITAKSIILDGRAMVVVADGKVDAAEVEGDARGMRIPRIAAWAESWSQLPGAVDAEAFLVAIDPTLSSAVALQVVASLVPSKQRRFAFLVGTPDGRGAVSVALPEASAPPPPSAPAGDPGAVPVGMVVTLAPDRVIVWSMSALEGTLTSPRLELTPASDGAWLTRLREDLSDIAKRRWEGRTRPEDQKTIVVMADPSVASGDLVNAIAAVRRDARGNELFPDVQLSTGLDAVAAVAAKQAAEAQAEKEAEKRRRDDAVARQEESARFVALLAAEGLGGDSVADMARRLPGADLNAQIDAIKESGSQVAIGGGGALGTRGGGVARIGMGSGPKVDGPGAGTGDGMKTPPGRITIFGKTAIDDTTLSVDMVQMKIQSAYMAGLKRCYKEALKKDPALRGWASLSFTVNEAGRTLNGTSSGMSREVDACIEGVMTGWRFNIPKDEDGEATQASFRIKLGLVPD